MRFLTRSQRPAGRSCFLGRRQGVVAGLAGILLALTGCGSSGSDTDKTAAAAPTSLAASSSSPTVSLAAPQAGETTAPQTDEEAVITAYKAYYNAIYTLTTPTDDEVRAAFADYAEPAVVENWVQVFRKYRTDDKQPGGSPTFGELQVSVADGSAKVSKCRDGSSELVIRTSTGEKISQGAPGQLFNAELARDPESAVWRIRTAFGKKDSC